MIISRRYFFQNFIWILLCLVPVIFCHAQNFNHEFDNLTTASGLSYKSVTCIVQDKKGFIWIGTQNGLNKYDGYKFTVYINNDNDSTSIPDNQINALYVDHEGMLWIGTNNGLSCYNELTNQFKSFLHDPNNPESLSGNGVWAISEDHSNTVWVGTLQGGLNRVSCVKTSNGKINCRFHSYMCDTLNKFSINGNNIWSIFFDKFNQGWVGTQSGLCRFIPPSEKDTTVKFESFDYKDTVSPGPHSINKQVWNIQEDRMGNIWLLSFGGMMDEISSEDINKPIGKFNIHHCISVIDQVTSSKRTKIWCILHDSDKHFWVATDQFGLIRFNLEVTAKEPKLTSPIWILNKYEFPRSIAGNDVRSILQDKAGSVWVGTDNGISFYHPHRDQFNVPPYNRVDSLLSYTTISSIIFNKNWLIAGTDRSGLIFFNLENNQYFKIDSIDYKSAVKSGRTRIRRISTKPLLHDQFGNIWFSTDSELVRVNWNTLKKNITNKTSKVLVLNETDSVFKGNVDHGLYSNDISRMLEDSSGQIWIATTYGINRFNPITGKLDRMPQLLPSRIRKEIVDENISRDIFKDLNGTIWLGTESKILVYDKAKDKFSSVTSFGRNKKIKVLTLFQNQKDILWVGTNGYGLFKLDVSNPKKEMIQIPWIRNLPNNVINAILGDGKGYLWCSTNYGISRISTTDSTDITNFNYKDGINNDAFVPNSAAISSDSTFLFGNNDGLTAFKPGNIRLNDSIGRVVVTDFSIKGESVFNNVDSKYRNQILQSDTVYLEYKENTFSIEFAALNYLAPEKNLYRFWLDGFDKDSLITSTRRFAAYTNLDEGTYTFHIKGSNNSGKWDEQGASFTIIISPPWSRTWQFRTFLILAFGFIFFLINRARHRNLELRKEKEIALHTTQLKEVFLANMSHEIRTPLNAIMGMTRLLKEKDPKPDQNKYLDAIMQSSDNLLVIVNDILDISKIEAGKINLERISFDLHAVITGVYNTLRFKAEEKSLLLTVNFSDSMPQHLIGDPVRLSQILINLCGNAIKFTEKGGVTISCSPIPQEMPMPGKCLVNFKISDTGIGIAQENFSKIFESFTQESSDTTRRFGGTGLGLAISKKLVELYGGEITIESVVNKGTVFQFSILYEVSEELPTPGPRQLISPEERESIRGISILLVEDNDFNRIVAEDTLREEIKDVRIDVAVNGTEAVEKVSTNYYDVVLMDVQMPEMNGYDATIAIRQLPKPINHIAIIAMTASALKDEEKRCFEAGMDDFIAKPFDPNVLLRKIYLLKISKSRNA